ALLNSQPMGFYSPSQLIQDARRHGITVKPVNINRSVYENSLELDDNGKQGIRLGFILVKSLNSAAAKSIAVARGAMPFVSINDIARRTNLSETDLACLASADARRELLGNRFQARWQVSAQDRKSTRL